MRLLFLQVFCLAVYFVRIWCCATYRISVQKERQRDVGRTTSRRSDSLVLRSI